MKNGSERCIYSYGSCSVVVASQLAFSWGICGWFSLSLCCRKNHVSEKGIKLKWGPRTRAGLPGHVLVSPQQIGLAKNEEPLLPVL